MDIHTLVETKIESDNDFQASLDGLDDAAKNERLAEKRKELLNAEYIAIKEKADKDGELAKNYKIRAEKAEIAIKERKGSGEGDTPKQSDVSTKDLLALTRNNIHDDDIETVQKFAKMENIGLADALKNEDLKAILNRRTEIRKTAEATNTSPARRTAAKVDDSVLLNNLSKGEIPKAGSEEAERVFWARRGGKR